MSEYSYYLSDNFPVSLPQPSTTPISLRKSYGVPRSSLVRRTASKLACQFSAVALDLVTIASGVYVADCDSPRGEEWRRKIKLTIPVKDVNTWQRTDVLQGLHAALSTVTGDCWHLDFVPCLETMPDTGTYLPFLEQRYVCLFSEGLDSYCGMALRLADDADARFLAVSAVIQSQCRPRMTEAVSTLNRLYQNRIHHVPIPFSRAWSGVRSRTDPYQRSRSFLLLSLAAVGALLTEQRCVEVYENGIEAFNFPWKECLEPGQASRAMHPVFLSKMSRLLTAIMGTSFCFIEPFLFKTKKDLVEQIQQIQGVAASNVAETISCMRFPQRKRGPKQCGRCDGCILRRMAFAGTVWANETEQYRASLDYTCPEFSRLLLQLSRLETALEQQEPYRALLKWSGFGQRHYLEWEAAAAETGRIPQAQLSSRVIDLFSRHAKQLRETTAVR